MQIADALDKAHRSSVVHRDLKPSNIMLTPTSAKLLDFGLAKPTAPLSSAVTLTAATENSPMTEQGTIVGTFQYMSPEQIEGKELDGRSDIFSFGAVLYEMLTGKPAFEGKNQLSIASAILEKEPVPISAMRPLTPSTLDHAIRRCLAKDREERWQTARDVKLELQWIAEGGSQGGTPAPVVSQRKVRERLAWSVATLLTLGLVAVAFLYLREKPPAPVALVRFEIPLPVKPALRLAGPFALSPDGHELAFAATSVDGIPRIWVRALNSLEMRPLPGTESVGSLLFWSPDSRFIAFDSGGKLQKIDISGGPAQTLCVMNKSGVGGSWSRDGVIIFGQWLGTLMRVSAEGGVASPVTTLDASHGDVAHTVPWFLPDGRHFLYLRDTGSGGAISIGSLDVKPEEQDSRRLIETPSGAAYVPSSDSGSGQLLFRRRGALMAQPFDPRRLNLSGEPVRVVEESIGVYLDYGLFSVSTNGVLAYWSPGNVDSQLTWLDEQGKVLGSVGEPGPYVALALSPDGTRAFVSKRSLPDGNVALWLLDLSRGTSMRFNLGSSIDDLVAVWAPDARRFIFCSDRFGQMDLYEKSMSGAEDAEALLKSNDWKYPLSWSPDGRFLLYLNAGGATNSALWLLPIGDHQKPMPFLRTAFNEWDGRFSPDGHWVAYASNESGRPEVYVRLFSPDAVGEAISGDKWLVSDGGGSSPSWQRDGKELYYINLDGKLMAVKVTTGPVFQSGAARVLFQAPPRSPDEFGLTQWGSSPDGKRFLFLVPETHGEVPFTVVLNWPAGLKK